MYKTIRKKVASTVSEIERTEDFAWGKWLKEPSVRQHTVEDFETSLYDTDQYNSWLEKPVFRKKTFDFRETYIFPEHKNLHPKKLKTNTVFFNISKSEIKKIKLLNKEFNSERQPVKIKFENLSAKLKEITWSIPQTRIEQKQFVLKPDVSKTSAVKSNLLSPDIIVKESKVDFQDVKSAPKIYRVKVTSLDKIRVTKIYYLKNISLHDVRILRKSLHILEKPVIEAGDLKYFITEEEKQPDVLMEEYFIEEGKPVDADLEFNIQDISENDAEQQITFLNPDDISFEGNVAEEEIDQDLEDKIEVPELEIAAEDKEEANISQPDVDVQEETPVDKIEEPVSETPVIEEEKEAVTEQNEVTEPEDSEETEEPEDELELTFESLYPYQEEGAEFLLDSKRAVLLDELGMGKTVQIIAGIKNHFLNKKIKSAVIVCEQSETGSRGKIPGEADGWLGQLHYRAPELKIETANKSSHERKKQWKNLPDVLLIPYDSFFSDYDENLIVPNDLKNNVCFIFDEVQNLFDQKIFKQQFSKNINPKYLWLTSSYPEAEIKEKLDKVFKDKYSFKNYLGRSRKEVEENLPGIVWQNKWLTLDEDQVEEYNEAFANAKEKVQWFLESGNPLRFNANVFTLVHQLKQVCNFSEKKGKSRKTNILLEQVNQIAKKKQKVVIFSQYEKAGIKKIEEVLKKNNIHFLSYAPGMSTKEMESVLKKFSTSSTVTALVAGVKPSRIKIPQGNVSYVIHFDLWWNPASLWQTEESVMGSSKGNEKSNLNIYSYLMKDTVEERIHSLLHRKGFLNKYIMETVNPDTIAEMITNPEWLEIFDMPDEEYIQKYQKGLLETEKRIDNYSTVEFMERAKNFFTKLGYKNLAGSEGKSGSSFDIRGIYKKAKYDQQMCARFLLKDMTSEEEIKKHLTELKEITNNGKFFLISRGSFEGDEINSSNGILLNREDLVNYFYQFIVI